jgi:hypothetical protein
VCGLLKGEGVREWPKNARSWARPRRGRGREVREAEGLTGGIREAERALARKETAPTGQPHRAAKKRARGLAPTGGTRLSGTEGTWARARARSWA